MAGTHASLSASKTKEWGNCPAVIPLAEMFGGDDPSGHAAQMGTCVHYLIERCLGEGVAPSTYQGRIAEILRPNTDQEGVSILKPGAKMPTLASGRVVFELDAELVEAATHMVDYVVSRLRELFPNGYLEEHGYAVTRAAVECGDLKLESKTNPLPHRKDTGGTADVTIDAWPEVLEVVDYKNGSGVFVPIEGNPQIRSYLLGRALEHGGVGEYAWYRASVCQPRHHQAPRPNGVSSEDLKPDELGAFSRWLDGAATRVDGARRVAADAWSAGRDPAGNQHEELTPEGLLERLYHAGYATVGTDGSHCTYCKAKTFCPAARDKAQEVARADFADDPPEDVKQAVADDVGMMGPNSLSEVLPWLPFLKKYGEAVEARARAMLAEGKPVPGWKLVQTAGDRTWREDLDVEAIVDKMAMDFGIERGKLFEPAKPPALLSGPKVEKLLPSKRRTEFSDRLLYRPVGGVKLVTEADKRPALEPGKGAAADFEDVEDDGGE